MPLTPFDVQNLESAMRGPGEAIAQNRRERMAQQHLNVEEDMRQRMLDAENRRMTAEEGRQNILQQRQDFQDKQALFTAGAQLNASGAMSDAARSSFNQWLLSDPHFKATGIQIQAPPQKPDPQAGQSAVAQTLKQADMWRQKSAAERAKGAGNYNPDDADRFDQYADIAEKWATNQTEPKPTKPERTGEENIYPPGVDPTKIGAQSIGKRYTYGTPGAAPAAKGKVLDVPTAKAYLQKAGGDKNKARQMAITDGYTVQ